MTTTSDLAEQLSNTHGLAKADARKVIDAILANITAAVATGEEVSLNGFGKFKLKDTPERQAQPVDGRGDHDRGVTQADVRAGEGGPRSDERQVINGPGF